MKTTSKTHTETAVTDRDTVIGSAISRTLAKNPAIDSCLTTEQFAVLAEGTIAEAERDAILGHMAVCDRCREVCLLTRELNTAEPTHSYSRGWYLTGGAFAAVALVVLAVKLTFQDPTPSPQQVASVPPRQSPVAALQRPEPAPTNKKILQQQLGGAFNPVMVARQFARTNTVDDLAALLGSSVSGSYGFAGGSSRQSMEFCIGAELFELELWLAAGDTERAGLAGERLLPLLRVIKNKDGAFDTLIRQLEKDQLDTVSRQLEDLLKSPQVGTMHLGGWAAAAKIALKTGKDPYFNGNPPQEFLRLNGNHFSPATREILHKMDKTQMRNDSAELRRLLDGLAASL